ncbi:MAG: molybdopterin-dependent oxidoreductase [Haliscomenobacter sp.]|nr:molybdopterin cofactor-binding domain-containing protein [Haliscomenobacter sp.]MBK9491694.1 molybdopterin-dependent oxidoreductase [Haliscomenobacter sp.]
MSKSNTPSSCPLPAQVSTRCRRNYLAVTASAILPKWAMDGSETALSPEDKGPAISAWVHIRPDGRITIYNPAAEMGQGSMTALPAIFAEELDADWAKVQIEYSPIEPKVYGPGAWGGRMMTVGSRAVSGYYESLRQAGAQARYVLMDSVAKKWKCAAGRTEH